MVNLSRYYLCYVGASVRLKLDFIRCPLGVMMVDEKVWRSTRTS